jgi:hypothetical protein
MFTLNSYDITDIDWNPVDFNVVGEQFDLIKLPITLDNGMKFNYFPFLDSVKDMSFNNKSGIILTNLDNNSNIISEKHLPSNTQKLQSIDSIVTDYLGSVYKLYSINNSISGLIADNSEFTIHDQLTFNFVGTKVYVENYYGQVLNNGGNGYDSLYFTPKTTQLTNSQLFDYLLGNGVITLFGNNTNYTQIVIQNDQAIGFNKLILESFDGLHSTILPNNSFLFLRSFTTPERSYKSVTDSYTVKYVSDPLLNENSLLSIRGDDSYLQNYLGIFPYKNINSDGTYDLYFHGLKNYQTTEYKYSTTKNNRIYYKIYSGTNQEKGLDKIYLGYQTNTINLNFPPNRETGFYFSPTSDAIPLSSCGLIEDGASAGNYPYTADRLFVSNSNNFQEINELSLIYNTTDTGENKFLCSWLYGNKTTGSKNWVDRYYNSAFYTLDQALSATYMHYNDTLNGTNNNIYDVPSKTILTPGVYYQYYHVGNEDSLNFLNDLNYTYNKGLSYSNILNVSSWTISTLKDNSNYNNYGLTFGNSAGFMGDYWQMDGSNYAIFQASDALLESKKLTTSIWLNVEDWNKFDGYQIFGNYYESGFGLINDAQTTAPILTIINNATNKIHNFNCRFGQVSQSKTTLTSPAFVQKLADLSYWVFDPVSLQGIKYNVDNSVISKDQDGNIGPIKLEYVNSIDQVEINSKEWLYIYDNQFKQYQVIDRDGNFVSQNAANQYANRIEIDLCDNVLDGLGNSVTIYGKCSVVDNNNSVWQVIGPNLYKDDNIIATVGASSEMSCDIYNNIWILSENDTYTKLDNNGKFIFKNKFSKSKLPIADDCPIPAPVIPRLLLVLDEDLPYLSTTNHDYILTYDDYQQILVTPPEPPPIYPKSLVTKRTRFMDFINTPTPIFDKDLISICGLSAIETDNMVMLDINDNQVYIINQLGELVLKLNLEVLLSGEEKAQFITGGDFTGYQNIRKYRRGSCNGKIKNNTLCWKFQTLTPSGSSLSYSINYDVTNLSKGWHNFTFTFDSKNGVARYYVDSILIPNGTVTFPFDSMLYYKYRTSLILGATTLKNTILNNFLNLSDGYRFVGSVGDLKLYNIVLQQGDVEQLYYSSPFAPKIRDLNWNMPVGYRNYTEEITEWFQFQLPTSKSKYYNINIHNLNVDDNLKNSIQLAIQKIIGKLSPAHTSLNQINWK